MSYRGHSVNLTMRGYDFESVDWPVPPIFETSEGPVVELVFWGEAVQRWIHAVSFRFPHQLPQGHVQVAMGDLEWIRQVCSQVGEQGLVQCVQQLEQAAVG